ncbi:hypothetical protein PM082_021025 [Marasmius tenuissimus]|nr:hypothetical protein PM082_021025 [Marasmius tenuissimus]
MSSSLSEPSYDCPQPSARPKRSGSSEYPRRPANLPPSRRALSRRIPAQSPSLNSLREFQTQVLEAKRAQIPLVVVLHELQNRMYPPNLETTPGVYFPASPGVFELLCALAEEWYNSEPSSRENHRRDNESQAGKIQDVTSRPLSLNTREACRRRSWMSCIVSWVGYRDCKS